MLKTKISHVGSLFFVLALGSSAMLSPRMAFATESQIVYSDSGNIWKINADGTGNTKLTTDNASSWGSMTSDLTKVVYGNYGAGNPNGNIYIMNADGTDQTDLTNATDESESSPAISANGTKIIYTRQDNDNRDIYIMNADGTDQTRLTTNAAEDNWAAISPDATKVVFTSARVGDLYQVYIMNADGTDQTALTSGVLRNEYPTFSPDGTKIAFEKDGTLYTMNIDGSDQAAISSGGVEVEGTIPSYNAAGTKIAFMGDDGIYVMNTDGSNKTRVLDHGLYPHFSLFQPIVLDSTAPVFTASSTTSSVTSSGASIGWTTDEDATSRVVYGLTGSYGTSTPTTDTSPLTTSHTVALSNLLSCTTYHYAAVTTDASSNTATSTDASFTTTGCAGGVAPTSATSTTVSATVAATSTLSDSGHSLTVSTPANVTSTSSSLVIQIKAQDADPVLDSFGTPDSLSSAASVVFDVKALINDTIILDSFDHPVTITYHYTDADISGLDESTLTMYHYHNGAWVQLNGCIVDTGANTITCSTPSFSVFGIFGSPLSSGSSSSSSSSSRSGASGGSVQTQVANLTAMGNITEADALKAQWYWLFPQETQTATGTTAGSCPYYAFSRRLQFGDEGEDVRALQQFLNCSGFRLADTGPGSPGNETVYFVERTRAALIRFQEAYAANVLAPIGAQQGSGIFAEFSKKQVESLMKP